MTSPDEFHELEERLSQALRAHGDSVEPSPDAYTRLARAVNEPPNLLSRVRGVLAPPSGRNTDIRVSGESLRPVAFVVVVAAVAGLGGFSLLNLMSSPTETVNAAPATADASDLVDRGDDAAVEADTESATAGEPVDDDTTEDDTLMADVADNPATTSVPADSEASGAAQSSTADPGRRFAGLTYAPVRATGLEAAQAFLDLLAVNDVDLEDETDRVVVRSSDSSVVTTLTIGAVGSGFMVLDAQSDRLELSIDDTGTEDPTDDDIVDTVIAEGSIDVSGSTVVPAQEIDIAVRSVIDGTTLGRASAPIVTTDAEDAYQTSVPITGAERAWVVTTVVDPDDGLRSLAAQSVLYIGDPDPNSYTVVGLSPDDPDGGLVVRSAPAGRRVGVIDIGSTNVRRRPIPPRRVDGETWWPITDPSGLEGWVASRLLAIDVAPPEATLVEVARTVIAAVTDADPDAAVDLALAKPVFLGPIVDPRPVSGPGDVDDLLTSNRRLTKVDGSGPEALAEFYGFDRWAEAEVFVPRGYRQEGAADRARSYFGDLPSVVIRSLNPETGGWERVHLFVSRDGDTATLVGAVLEEEPVQPAVSEPAPPTTEPTEQGGGD